LSGIATIQPLEAREALKFIQTVDVSYVSLGRSFTPIIRGTNEFHGDTAIVAETGMKLPV
jgi:hypothetical protein